MEIINEGMTSKILWLMATLSLHWSNCHDYISSKLLTLTYRDTIPLSFISHTKDARQFPT